MEQRIAVLPGFQTRLAAPLLSPEDGSGKWNEDICVFSIPAHLRDRWWQQVAPDMTAAFSSGQPLEDFLTAVEEFAKFKGLELPPDAEYRILIEDAQKLTEPKPFHPSTQAVINLSDADVALCAYDKETGRRVDLSLRPGDGVAPTERNNLCLEPAGPSQDVLVLLEIRDTLPLSVVATKRFSQEPVLLPGIRIYSALGSSVSAADRLRVSHGTIRNFPVVRDDYREGAILPREPWRPLTAEESQPTWTEQFVPIANSTIALLKIPEALYQPFVEMGTAELETAERYNQLRKTEPFRNAVMELLSYLEEFRQHEGAFEIAAVLTQPGLPCVTLDRTVDKYVGLHFDDWDHLYLSSRGLGQNRILVNLGREAREFMVINLPVSDLVAAVREGGGEIGDHHSEWRDLVQKFCQMYPNYPVLKIKVEPGEAYIAPTENLIHDGTTLGRTAPDVNLQVRGYIWPKKELPRA